MWEVLWKVIKIKEKVPEIVDSKTWKFDCCHVKDLKNSWSSWFENFLRFWLFLRNVFNSRNSAFVNFLRKRNFFGIYGYKRINLEFMGIVTISIIYRGMYGGDYQ